MPLALKYYVKRRDVQWMRDGLKKSLNHRIKLALDIEITMYKAYVTYLEKKNTVEVEIDQLREEGPMD
jgi:uncharacterized protein (UPF0216 family)